MNVGYKQTEVGVIPEDWEVKRLASLVDPSRGIRYGIVQPGKFDPQGRYMIRGQDYSRGWVDPSELFRVGAAIEERYRNARVKRGDLLITIVGAGTGTVEEVPDWLDGANLTQTTARIAIAPQRADSGFCKLTLQSHTGRTQVAGYIKGAAQPGLNCGDIEKFLLPLPPTQTEQRAIAGALSDVDRLLGALARHIAKKRDLKQAAMQQLLTGQTRLPGFHDDWDQVRLGDLFSFKNGLNKGKEFFGYGTPIVNYMDVFRSSAIHSSNLEGRVSLSKAELKNFDVKKGDVFFTRTSETTEEIGIASVVLDEPTDTVFSGFVLRARPVDERLNDGFKAYCFGSASVRKQITSKASYTTRALTNGRILSEVLLPLPSLSEQTAIVTVLSDMDAELVALEQRRDKTRDLKQAMMQELLTGKTRLI